MKGDSESKYPEADSKPLDGKVNLNNGICSIVSVSYFTRVADDIGDLEKDLEGVGARWYQIGVALGLSTNTLDQLKDQNLEVNAN